MRKAGNVVRESALWSVYSRKPVLQSTHAGAAQVGTRMRAYRLATRAPVYTHATTVPMRAHTSARARIRSRAQAHTHGTRPRTHGKGL
eukprot:3860440-Pleurochrysis_carterae.AAC.4